MSDSLRQRVVDRIRQPGFAGKPSAVLGACGKHRSYREHFEDLGKRQELVAVKDELYSRGIKDAVDQGVWKSLKDGADFVPFGHVFLGRRRSQILVGRLVASPDSVGRSEYPLMLFVLVDGIAPEHVQSFVLPMLAELEASVMAAESLADVTAAIAASRTTLTAWSAGEFSPIPNAGQPLARLGTLPTYKTSRIGIINALYQLDRRFKSSRTESRTGVSRGLHLRIPCTPKSSSVEALLWCNVIAAEVNADASATVFCPIDRPWLDLVVGDMSPADFFCLHANEKVLPPVDAIPYQIDPAVVAELTTRIDRPASPSVSESVQGDEEVTEKRGWKKWLGLK